MKLPKTLTPCHTEEARAARDRQCGAKKQYPTDVTADAGRLFLERKTGERFDVYLCNFCGFYHIGKAYRKGSAA